MLKIIYYIKLLSYNDYINSDGRKYGTDNDY